MRQTKISRSKVMMAKLAGGLRPGSRLTSHIFGLISD